MTDNPDEREDTIGLGVSDRAPRAFRLATRLDRLTLRLTRRPRLVATTSGLVVMGVVAGAVVYFGPASVSQSGSASSQCKESSQSKLDAAAIAGFLKRLPQPTNTSSAYSSSVTVTIGGNGPVVITVSPATRNSTCSAQARQCQPGAARRVSWCPVPG